MNDLFPARAVTAQLTVSSKKALFQALGDVAERAYGLDPAAVLDALSMRERLGPTGFGGGTAIPHAKLAGLNTVVGVFARLGQAIDYDAVDGEAVDLVAMLLSPPEMGTGYLKSLAGVSRLLRDRPTAAKLRAAGSQDALLALLSDDGFRDAA